MAIPPSFAAGAYQRLSQLSNPVGQQGGGLAGLGAGSNGQKSNFGALVEQFASQVTQAGQVADAQTAQAVRGKADLVDVVTAVAESEAAIETLVSVRDKVIQAYEEIMRMPI